MLLLQLFTINKSCSSIIKRKLYCLAVASEAHLQTAKPSAGISSAGYEDTVAAETQIRHQPKSIRLKHGAAAWPVIHSILWSEENGQVCIGLLYNIDISLAIINLIQHSSNDG